MDTNFQLTDGVIIIRPPCADDLPSLIVAVQESLSEIQPWMDWAVADYGEASAAKWLELSLSGWERSAGFQFAIIDANTGEYLGNCSIDGINTKYRFCNLGYWVRTSRTRQGIASRAARLSARFAFETVHLVRAEIVIASENTASQRVAQKAGAHYEGILRNRMIVNSNVYDALMYSFTPADFELS